MAHNDESRPALGAIRLARLGLMNKANASLLATRAGRPVSASVARRKWDPTGGASLSFAALTRSEPSKPMEPLKALKTAEESSSLVGNTSNSGNILPFK